MTDIDRDRVADLMSRLATGDLSALVPFIQEFGGRLAATIRRVLAPFGRHDVIDDHARMQELVFEAAFCIFDHAGAWNPEGSLPWTWAERAIREVVVVHLGHPSVELDVDQHDHAALSAVRTSTPVGPGEELLALAQRFPEIGLLDEAITLVGSHRNRLVHIQYRLQKAMGDPSPAITVANEFDLTPDNVRQIDRRMRLGLQKLIDTDERYRPLAELDWLAA